MKIIIAIFTAALILMGATSVKAQDKNYPSAGLKGGLNLSSVINNGEDDNNLSLGFHAGVYDKIPVNEVFAFQPELLYSMKGVKINYDESSFAEGSSNMRLHYIDLPLKLVFNLSDNLELQVGPYVGYLIGANVQTDAEVLNYFDIDSDEELDRENFNPIDYGLTAGLAFDFDAYFIGLDYNLGLNPVAKSGESSEEIFNDAMNSTLQMSIGLRF